MEDVDKPRCVVGMDQFILRQLSDCGLHPDAPPQWQSQRGGLYQTALEQLIAKGRAYPCNCTRRSIEAALSRRGQTHSRHAELIYPGTCRQRRSGGAGQAWRMRTDTDSIVHWSDRRLGAQQQDVEAEVGDFVLRRADSCFSYQLAVVVDDAAHGITDVVRGEDLTDNTARQILLQQCLGLPTPRYLHTPLVLGANLEKLSKQNGAQAIDTSSAEAALLSLGCAARVLGLPAASAAAADALAYWVKAWTLLYLNPVAPAPFGPE
jgi:glutamyl-Q tRNA(Asp) synthetase